MNSSTRITRLRSKELDIEFYSLQSPKKPRRKPVIHRQAGDKENVPINLPTASEYVDESRPNNQGKQYSFLDNPSKDIIVEMPLTEELGFVTKKLLVSDQERDMNGAPVNDLYDVVLVPDKDLTPLTHEVNINNYYQAYFESNVWAEKYLIVESIRRIIYFDKNANKPDIFSKCCQVAVQELSSLRSTSSRNALYLLNLLGSRFNFGEFDCLMKSCIDGILLKVRSGPRFLVDEASRIMKELVTHMPTLPCIRHLLSHNESKNTDVLNAIFTCIYALLLKLENRDVRITDFEDIIPGLLKGLSVKSTQAKVCARNSFLQIERILGEGFLDAIGESFSNSQRLEVQNTISSMKTSSGGKVSSQMLPQRGHLPIQTKESRDKCH